mgnify:CR=1 FL=1
MRTFCRILLSCLPITACFITIGCVMNAGTKSSATGPNGLPVWAYHIVDPVQPEVIELKGSVHLPGSAKEYDASVTESFKEPPDWYPDEHPVPPRVVAGGQGGPAWACGSCHMMSGQGHPENADLAGLPVGYFVRQLEYFRNDSRKEPARMNEIAKTLSDEDMLKAAQYFSSLKPRPWVKVIETAEVPRTYISALGRIRMLHPEGGTEPIGQRIIQLPVDPIRTLNRDPHSTFIAYVPPGSIAKGEQLVKTGNGGKTLQCVLCHGESLHGMGEVPRLAGLQPVYITRQLISIQNGSSAGAGVALMKEVVARLSEDDIISISAYLGSLTP